MSAREFSFKAELLTEDEINQIADCVVRKLLEQMPGLVTANDKKQDEPPIKMGDICKLLQISDTTAREWMAKGSLPFHRKGKRVYFFKSEVLNSMQQPQRKAGR